MSPAARFATVDLGASSGRVMLATVGAGELGLRPVHRFRNDAVHIWDGNREAMHWDLPWLFAELCRGLARADLDDGPLDGIGVDAWAVDYGLLRDGRLIGVPHHYRDERAELGVRLVHEQIDPDELYRRNGLQFLRFTSIYQLAADAAAGLLDDVDQALLIPDLIGYWLTGRAVCERTNASTTGLLGVDGRWDAELCHRAGLPAGLFPGVIEPGTALGAPLPEVMRRLRLRGRPEVRAVASHDTAAAVAAIPMDPATASFVSCGTWGLVGVELPHPILDPACRAAGFTNEQGADGRITFLHNVMGLWLLEESMRQWEREGHPADLDSLLHHAAAADDPVAVLDVADPRFLAPGDMPRRIAQWYRERDLPAPGNRPAIVRAVLTGLAAAFADAVHTAAQLSGVGVRTVHLVGGGARNELLCQLLADHAGLPVLAGPVEASALGNALTQARAHGAIPDDAAAARNLVAAAFPARRYLPNPLPIRKTRL
ncbi:rhamnulokinase [Nocardia cyriacigeorgica]|uniref:rhamnulokinase n=1 Tax=Nocardia cyriacigeorgica TaxID=135487 RepID=UPI0018943018|nr:rhamnulokinase family protein [Nocardia cyriacigeorgica]MBF6440223.1 rhamnulokinase [Nocardia cyriacigeorgica]